MKPSLLIFAKAPRMGFSKTRLAAGIGTARAWRIKRCLDNFTCQTALGSAWHVKLAVAPDRDVNSSFGGTWPTGIDRIAQGKGNLGDRMSRAFRAHNYGPVCIIGSDLPDLRRADIADAFVALRRHDVVFGPATDGGYWLIGMTARMARRANLNNVRWSSVHTLADTLACLPIGARVGFLRELEDVDDAASYRRRTRQGLVSR